MDSTEKLEESKTAKSLMMLYYWKTTDSFPEWANNELLFFSEVLGVEKSEIEEAFNWMIENKYIAKKDSN